jgi:hypothetical protein
MRLGGSNKGLRRDWLDGTVVKVDMKNLAQPKAQADPAILGRFEVCTAIRYSSVLRPGRLALR